jgi:hypothetical protein
MTYTREIVLAKVRQEFPQCEAEEVMTILEAYGKLAYEREDRRVQLAILKLSEGNLDQLRANVKIAKQDYRDVLAYAEYPSEMRHPTWQMEAQRVEAIRQEDRKQYLEWLER